MSAPALWRDLRRFTDARVGLGRAGNGVPTAAHLDFQEAHARARDAVWSALDVARWKPRWRRSAQPALRVRSAAPDRRTYLLRPDLGRRLREEDRARCRPRPAPAPSSWPTASAPPACRRRPRRARTLIPALRNTPLARRRSSSPNRRASRSATTSAKRRRSRPVAVLIGERPGLSATDSMGLYITWAPRRGRTDAERNCIVIV
jgi:ethanolamine ammonia-lyase small subunit